MPSRKPNPIAFRIPFTQSDEKELAKPPDNPEEKHTRTRQQIVSTAFRLLMHHGFEKVSIIDIARACRMSHANVYRFFRSKTDILEAVEDEWLASIEEFVRLVAAQPGSAAQRIEEVAVRFFLVRIDQFEKYPQFFFTLRTLFERLPSALPKRRKLLTDLFTELIAEGIKTGEFISLSVPAAVALLENATAVFIHPLALPVSHLDGVFTETESAPVNGYSKRVNQLKDVIRVVTSHLCNRSRLS